MKRCVPLAKISEAAVRVTHKILEIDIGSSVQQESDKCLIVFATSDIECGVFQLSRDE
jgi:hypothetical protein